MPPLLLHGRSSKLPWNSPIPLHEAFMVPQADESTILHDDDACKMVLVSTTIDIRVLNPVVVLVREQSSKFLSFLVYELLLVACGGPSTGMLVLEVSSL